MGSFLFAFFLFLKLTVSIQNTDEVTYLPGWEGQLPSRQYSGYLNISESKHIHYWLVESESNPNNDPLLVWFNGCSSLDGYFAENGPFGVDADDYSKLFLRPYRWSLVTNLLYLESPIGTGYSWSSNPADYNSTDDTTAVDNYLSLEKFFTQYPEYNSHELFFAGESYAGIYIPTLTQIIYNATQNGTYRGPPLKGLAIGNGCTGNEIGICGNGPQGLYYEWEFLLQLSFFNNSFKKQISKTCDWENAKENDPNSITPECETILTQASALLSNISIYNVYGDCVAWENVSMTEKQQYGTLPPPPPGNDLHGKNRISSSARTSSYDVWAAAICIDSRALSYYLSQPEVIKAMHVITLDWPWYVCKTAPGSDYISNVPNIPRDIYPTLIENYRVLIYNGDWDACVPYTDNEAWTTNMGYPIDNSWHTWLYTSESGATDQVGGYAVKYHTNANLPQNNTFQFITVRGAGHMVPTDAPGKGFEMLRRFLNGIDF